MNRFPYFDFQDLLLQVTVPLFLAVALSTAFPSGQSLGSPFSSSKEPSKRQCSGYIPGNSNLAPGQFTPVCDGFCTAKSGANCNSKTEYPCCTSQSHLAVCSPQYGGLFGPGKWAVNGCPQGVTCGRWEQVSDGSITSSYGAP